MKPVRRYLPKEKKNTTLLRHAYLERWREGEEGGRGGQRERERLRERKRERRAYLPLLIHLDTCPYMRGDSLARF